MQFLGFLGGPLGYVMEFIYKFLVSDYGLSLVLFTVLLRVAMFPLRVKRLKESLIPAVIVRHHLGLRLCGRQQQQALGLIRLFHSAFPLTHFSVFPFCGSLWPAAS